MSAPIEVIPMNRIGVRPTISNYEIGAVWKVGDFLPPRENWSTFVPPTLQELAVVNASAVANFVFTHSDVLNTVTLHIGTPPRPHTFLIEMGSYSTWLRGNRATFERTNTTADVVHGFGKAQQHGVTVASGKLIHEKICLGTGVLTCKKQRILIVWEQNGTRNSQYFDGVLGLAVPALVKDEHHLTHHNDMTLGVVVNGVGKNDSFVVFGSLQDVMKFSFEESSYAPNLVNVPVHTFAQYWVVVGHLQFPNEESQQVFVMLNPTMSVIAVPPSMFMNVISSVIPKMDLHRRCNGTESGIFCECGIQANPWMFKFVGSDGNELSVTLGPTDLFEVVSPGSTQCKLRVVKGPRAVPIFLLGDNFIRKVFTIYDVSNPRLSFMKPKESTQLYEGRYWSKWYFFQGFFVGIAVIAMIAPICCCFKYFFVSYCLPFIQHPRSELVQPLTASDGEAEEERP